MNEQSFRDFLKAEYILRCRKNSRYSIRAYAKSLGIDHSTLAQLMRGKRTLTKATIHKLARNMGMTGSQLKAFLKNANPGVGASSDYHPLTLEAYSLISDWYHYALFELLTVKHFQQDFEWIARTLGISTGEAKDSFERLRRLGLLVVDEKGFWRQSTSNITTVNNDFTAAAFRRRQKALMDISAKALEEIPFEQRSHSAMTMAFNSNRLPEVKERIMKFRRELCDWLQQDTDRDAVYEMTLAFFPLTATEGKGQ